MPNQSQSPRRSRKAGENAQDLVFVGFNSRVAALHRASGVLAWSWRCPRGTGFVSLLVDTDVLFASVDGYTYGLDPRTGSQLWANDLPGFGTGVPCLASVRSSNALFATVAELKRLQEQRQGDANPA